jgi:hypothetical protein
MKIEKVQSDNVTINISGNKQSTGESHTSSAKKSKNSSNVIFAGDLNIKDDMVESKKRLAGRNALKTLIEQYQNDKGLDGKVLDMKENQRKLLADADLASKNVRDLKSLKVGLMSSYGVSKDSQEQKDLDLLEKSIFSPDKMTEDDNQQLKNIGPLTDYQKAALKNDSMQKIFQERVDNAANDIININHSITSMALERLKTHPMIDAQKEAAQIIEDAGKEVIGILLKDAKDNVDETAKKNKEEAVKEQEEQDKKDAASKDTDDVDNTSLSISEQTKQIQNADELKLVASKQNLIEDDIKGLVVDEEA